MSDYEIGRTIERHEQQLAVLNREIEILHQMINKKETEDED
jgi:hypothetical protein